MPSGKQEIAAWKAAVAQEVTRVNESRDTKNNADTGITIALACANVFFGQMEGVGGVVQAAKANLLGAALKTGVPVVPNPYFILNGHDDDEECPLTRNYLKGRRWTEAGSATLAVAGTASSVGMGGINAAGIAMHGNAVGSTAAHIVQLSRIAMAHRQTETISRWLTTIVAMKSAKAALRGGQVVGAAIPAASLGVGIGVGVAKLGLKLSMRSLCLTTSMALHWRAYQEQTIGSMLGRRPGLSGGGASAGPATRIVVELFRRRGATRVFGQYDALGLIREPAGYLAVNDKIMLM